MPNVIELFFIPTLMFIRQIIEFIPKAYRKQGMLTTLAAILQGVLNMLGLTVLIPLIVLIIDSTKMLQYPWLASHRNFTIVGIVCFILAKNGINVWLRDFRINFVNSIYKYYTQKNYEGYFGEGLLFIKNNRADNLAYNTNAVCYLFAYGTLSLLFAIVEEIVFLLLICLGICCFSPLIALSIFLSLCPFIGIYSYWVRKKLNLYAEAENEAKKNAIALANDTFRGYAEIQINNSFTWFKKRFEASVSQITNCRKQMARILHIPQAIVECYMVVGLVIYIFVAENNSQTKITLGILSVAILRILPSLRSLITMITQCRSNAFTLDIIKNAPQTECADNDVLNISFEKQIEISKISFGYSQKQFDTLSNFSLTINKGECVGIQGVSGVGKTTLINLLLGFYFPQEGAIGIDNLILTKNNCKAWQKLIAYVPQDIFILNASLAQNIALGNENIDNNKLSKVILQSGLADYVASLVEGINTIIGHDGKSLSGGERQRIGIARALYKDAEILLFDEPTSWLDSKTEKGVLCTIVQLSAKINSLTLIIISHKTSTLSFCNRVVQIA